MSARTTQLSRAPRQHIENLVLHEGMLILHGLIGMLGSAAIAHGEAGSLIGTLSGATFWVSLILSFLGLTAAALWHRRRLRPGLRLTKQIATTLHAAGLGLLGLFVLNLSAITDLRLVVCVATLSFGASAAILQPSLRLAVAQLLMSSLPMAVTMLVSGNTFQQVFGLASIGFLALMFAGARNLKTRREQATKATNDLASQTNRFHAAVNNMSHGLLMVNREGRVLVSNGKLAELVGLQSLDLVPGMSLARLVGRMRAQGGNSRLVARAIARRMRAEDTGEHTVVAPHGRILQVSRRDTAAGDVVLVIDDVTEEVARKEELHRMATTDELTGLLNRGAVRERARAMLSRGAAAVHLLDLDHFKEINDTLGHPIGDRVLCEVARRISAACEDEVAIVGRLGGDEFVIVQPLDRGLSPDWIVNLVLASMVTGVDVGDATIDVGASIGIAISLAAGADFDELFQQADTALYEAKGRGRNCAVVYETKFDRRAQQRADMERLIADALDQDHFHLVYQPIVDAVSRRIVSFEALARFRHPELGPISPAQFIPVAEETGQIVALGRWAVETACQAAANWPGDIGVSINFSARQFTDSAFPAFLEAVLDQYAIAPARIELEITETALLERSERTMTMLADIKALGVRVSLDDFGAGFSSLSHLRLFPFDKIKVDGSFVREMGNNDGAEAVVLSVAFMGKVLGVPVVAESVETLEQLEQVRAAGCSLVQGWLLGRPAPAEDLHAFFVEPCADLALAG